MAANVALDEEDAQPRRHREHGIIGTQAPTLDVGSCGTLVDFRQRQSMERQETAGTKGAAAAGNPICAEARHPPPPHRDCRVGSARIASAI
jgi:hypothetical protein